MASPLAAAPVVLLSQYIFPEGNATGDLLTSLAVGLVRRGISVTAYAAQPTYFGRNKVPHRMRHEGVTIRRLWSTQLGRRKPLFRIVDMVTFMSRLLLEAPTFSRNSIVISVTNPPLLPVVGALCNLLFGNRFVLLVHDVYPEVAVRLGAIREGGLVHRALRILDRFMLWRATSIVVLGRDMADVVCAKSPSVGKKLAVIPNWADPNVIRPMSKAASRITQHFGLDGTFVVQYSGNVGLSQNLETILAAAELLLGADVVFTIVGEGLSAPTLKAAVLEKGLTNVRFLPRARQEHLAESLAACDIALVPLSSRVVGLSVPSKFYGILASGRPVIALMERNAEVARAVMENDCGRVLPADDPDGLARLILELSNNPELVHAYGTRARLAFERHYTSDHAISAYETLLTQTCYEGQIPTTGS